MLARWKGEVTTHAVGFVASIATVILMAGKRVVVDSNCFCLIHLPWTMVQGNANDLNKEIENLEKCKHAMMSFYMKKAIVPAQTIEDYLADESWFLGEELAQIFNVEVLQNDEQLDIAAKVDLSKYKNIPERLIMKNKAEDVSVEEIKEEVTEEVAEEVKEEVTEEQPKEEPVEVETSEEVVEEEEKKPEEVEVEKTSDELKAEIESLKSRIAELEAENAELKAKCGEEKKAEEVPASEEVVDEQETITKAEADKRVSGMQASMQKQINALSTDITNFKNQLQAKEEELKSAKAEITSLSESLNKSNEELSAMASTLAEKTTALEKLNASVNAQAEELPTMNEGLAKCASPAEKVAFIKSGKYVR